MITGSTTEPLEATSAEEKQRQLTTFLFNQTQPLDVVKKAVKLARENRATFEEEYLLPFGLELPMTAMFETMTQLEKSLVSIDVPHVEVLGRLGGNKKDACHRQTDRAGVDGEFRHHSGAGNRLVGTLHLLGARPRSR